MSGLASAGPLIHGPTSTGPTSLRHGCKARDRVAARLIRAKRRSRPPARHDTATSARHGLVRMPRSVVGASASLSVVHRQRRSERPPSPRLPHLVHLRHSCSRGVACISKTEGRSPWQARPDTCFAARRSRLLHQQGVPSGRRVPVDAMALPEADHDVLVVELIGDGLSDPAEE